MAETIDKMNDRLREIRTSLTAPQEQSFSSNKRQSENEIETSRKRVRFSSEADRNKTYTPLVHSKKPVKKQDSNKLILKLWVRLSQAGEYELLEQRLKEFGLTQSGAMYDFFKKEGPNLLMYATLYWRNPEHLRFICEHVPENLLRDVLRADNYSNIEGLLLGHTGMEKMGLLDEARINEGREKLKLLMKIDPEGLEEYMKSEYFETKFSKNVKTNFKEVFGKNKANKKTITQS